MKSSVEDGQREERCHRFDHQYNHRHEIDLQQRFLSHVIHRIKKRKGAPSMSDQTQLDHASGMRVSYQPAMSACRDESLSGLHQVLQEKRIELIAPVLFENQTNEVSVPFSRIRHPSQLTSTSADPALVPISILRSRPNNKADNT